MGDDGPVRLAWLTDAGVNPAVLSGTVYMGSLNRFVLLGVYLACLYSVTSSAVYFRTIRHQERGDVLAVISY